MNATSFHAQKFRWRWLGAGFAADIVGMLFVPSYDWTGHPVETWLSLVFFPFGMMSGLAPLFRVPAEIYWYAPLPVYGFLLATVAQGRHWRSWCYSLATLHTAGAVVACGKYFRL